MRESSVSVSAPGSIMLLGEHGVLHGRRAIACAIDQRISMHAHPRTDRCVHLTSSLGEVATTLDDLSARGALPFLQAAVMAFGDSLANGLDIRVESAFSSTAGLGSSAAVTVAAVTAIDVLLERHTDLHRVQRMATDVIQAVQGRGSGCDVAASAFGGLVQYRMEPREIRRLPGAPPLTLVYSGNKTPTGDVIAIVEARRAEAPDPYERWFDRMDEAADMAAEAIDERNWDWLGMILNENQTIMERMELSNHALQAIVTRLQNDAAIHGAKISGSGLGDCAVGLGHATSSFTPYVQIPVAVSEQGVIITCDDPDGTAHLF